MEFINWFRRESVSIYCAYRYYFFRWHVSKLGHAVHQYCVRVFVLRATDGLEYVGTIIRAPYLVYFWFGPVLLSKVYSVQAKQSNVDDKCEVTIEPLQKYTNWLEMYMILRHAHLDKKVKRIFLYQHICTNFVAHRIYPSAFVIRIGGNKV